jgi:hypothetical protein
MDAPTKLIFDTNYLTETSSFTQLSDNAYKRHQHWRQKSENSADYSNHYFKENDKFIFYFEHFSISYTKQKVFKLYTFV